jgi:hypothetical protein
MAIFTRELRGKVQLVREYDENASGMKIPGISWFIKFDSESLYRHILNPMNLAFLTDLDEAFGSSPVNPKTPGYYEIICYIISEYEEERAIEHAGVFVTDLKPIQD